MRWSPIRCAFDHGFRRPPASAYDGTLRRRGVVRHVIRREPPAALSQLTTARWQHDVPDGAPSTVVREIYPTADVVPMNLLRMYVEFSAPMSGGRSYEFVKLYAEGTRSSRSRFSPPGGAVELWDPEHTRLTILFDPGRIKRDLKPHEEMGLPLRDGQALPPGDRQCVARCAGASARAEPMKGSFASARRTARSCVLPIGA